MNVQFIEICWLFKESWIVGRAADNDDDWCADVISRILCKVIQMEIRCVPTKKLGFSIGASNLSHLNEALLIIWPKEMRREKKNPQPNWIEFIREMEG